MSIISSGLTTGTALVSSGDTTGALVFKTNGSTTALTLNANQSADFTGSVSVSGNTTISGILTVTSPSSFSNPNVSGTFKLLGATSGFTGIVAAANAGSTIFTLPASDGLNGQIIQTNGTGTLSWVNQSVGGGGGGGSGTSTTRTAFTATEGQTIFNVTYAVGQIDVFMNGSKLVVGTEVTASNGAAIVLASPANAGDIIDTVVYSSQWILNGTNLYYSGGSVGLGTSTPGARLSLGSEAATRKLLVYDGGNNATYVGFGTPDTSNLDIFTFTGGNTRFGEWSSGGAFSERMRLTGGGNLLIGGAADRQTTVGTAHLDIFNGTAPAGTLTNGVSLYSSNGDFNFMNSSGNGFKVGYRNLPPVGTQTGSYTLGVNDVGKYVQVSTGGSITIPTSTFAEGDAITIYNNTTGNITITCSAPTAYIAGTDTIKTSMTLATRGVATVLFYSATTCVVTGNVT